MVVGLSRQHKIAIISILFISNNIEENVNMTEMEDVKKKTQIVLLEMRKTIK